MFSELKMIRFPVETGILLALCIVLPLAEAPKNLLWFAYVVTWFVNRYRYGRDFGGKWETWDTLIALWIASGYLVAAFAGLHKNELRGAGDLLRYGSILWLVMRGGYSAKEIKWLLAALVLSTIAGLAFGYWQLLVAKRQTELQLHSVGHVNHTAIYLAIVLGLCANWVFVRWYAWSPMRRGIAIATTLLVLVSLIVTASRGALGVSLVMLLSLGMVWWRRWRMPLVVASLGVALVVVVGAAAQIEVVRKHRANVMNENVLSYRDGIWRVSLVAWERYPWFGVGMGNFGIVSHDLVKEWRTKSGKEYDEKQYVPYSHAHSLYLNSLAERGVIGSAALIAVLITWFVCLLRFLPRLEDDDLYWLLWGGAPLPGLLPSAWVRLIRHFITSTVSSPRCFWAYGYRNVGVA